MADPVVTWNKTRDRNDILEIHPNATWMPWDECPVGARVLTRKDALGRREVGTVVGVYQNPDRPDGMKPHDCPCCTCGPDPMNGWWIVKRDSGEVTVEYPPTLSPETP